MQFVEDTDEFMFFNVPHEHEYIENQLYFLFNQIDALISQYNLNRSRLMTGYKSPPRLFHEAYGINSNGELITGFQNWYQCDRGYFCLECFFADTEREEFIDLNYFESKWKDYFLVLGLSKHFELVTDGIRSNLENRPIIYNHKIRSDLGHDYTLSLTFNFNPHE